MPLSVEMKRANSRREYPNPRAITTSFFGSCSKPHMGFNFVANARSLLEVPGTERRYDRVASRGRAGVASAFFFEGDSTLFTVAGGASYNSGSLSRRYVVSRRSPEASSTERANSLAREPTSLYVGA